MKILGIDPGYAITGWAVIEKNKGRLKLIDGGDITSPAKTEHAFRLKKLFTDLKKVIKKYQPEVLAVEDIFFFKNLKTAVKVAEARGVILLAGQEKNLTIQEFTPLQIKQAIVGYGRAEKKQIQQMVKNILGLEKIPKPDDTADAAAVAICAANSLTPLRSPQ